MRLEIILKGKNNFKVPFNYNHILSAIIYNKIADLNFANELHSSKSFKFFTFSQIYIPKRRIVKDGIIAKDGVISFYISSPNDFLIKSLVDGFLEDLEISFQNQKLTIQKIEALKTPEFSSKSEFKTLAPIIVRTKKEIDGELKIWDLAPSDKFFKSLENNLIKKYIKFNNLTKTDKKINIYSDMNFVKRKRISINKGNVTTHHRAYMMDLILEGDLDLIEFAYDVGIGEKNSMGFGMVKLLK
ncbi:CRISPR-associated endoribonuclease Cas6 [uncultured Methanobrevibacter sp.]|uniref:CRISPR-associated endoribonuclease Cas6 n=1 Tax=uncultured Methanobrevibacter sp. TaxID=253161 RepID=UPI0025920D60|nr:CRISPR-associated endoribonuclease Cas6 [uncultured Methanobrevibacter sp.]